jgi:hypothetical protein
MGLQFQPSRVTELSSPVERELSGIAFLAQFTNPSARTFLTNRLRMSMFAMRSGGVYCGLARASEDIFSSRHKSNVTGIDALPVIADEVVKLENAFSQTLRQWFNQPRIHQAMYRTSDIENRRTTVACGIERPGPNPTSSGSVHSNLGKDAPDVLRLKVRNGEILGISQARVLLTRVREWLGPWLCVAALSRPDDFTAFCPLWVKQ